ncbi:class I SAM-dependent methyltransferase [Actinoplanes sp. TBRC 11911]|uniref:class I SAM-dependent methyltransferase n=1 Tax=Actinoplanes sp. TBRC 11911 TaxID=2729386 RepID=UPI0028A2D09D|nr:class I SAM-dependent methyltransferase [Actinoplanes sp. TBRC 11911]
MSDHAAHANSFGPAAETYERGRPSYPSEALDWLLPAGHRGPSRQAGTGHRASTPDAGPPTHPLGGADPRPLRGRAPSRRPRVVDLGAGTGKLTRQIAARGLPVTAVDPSAGMLAELRRAVPGVTAVQGTAESIPLPADSADVVLVAQAWHWVDASRAVPAIAGILSPGGRLGLLWNVRDESADWVRRLGEIIGSENRERSTTIGPPFGPSETARFRWTEVLGPERLIDMVASRSRIILLPPDEKAAVLSEVRRLMATHPDLVGRTEYELPYITECTRADLPLD